MIGAPWQVVEIHTAERLQHFDRLSDDLRPDAVAGDDCDAMDTGVFESRLSASCSPDARSPDILRMHEAIHSRSARPHSITVVVSAQSTQRGPAPGDWPLYSRNLAGTRYSPLTEINTGNVATLAPAWSVRLTQPAGRRGGGPAPAVKLLPRDAVPVPQEILRQVRRAVAPTMDSMPRGSNPQATPIVVGGVMYLPARGNQVLAIEAHTGKEVWRYLMPLGMATTARGVAYWPGDGGSRRASC